MCDCDAPAVFQTAWPIARKPHTCCECGGEIQIGAKYELSSGLWDNVWASYRTCQSCHAVRRAYSDTLSRYDCAPCFGALWDDVLQGEMTREAWIAFAAQPVVVVSP
jgi:hypothetical protein